LPVMLDLRPEFELEQAGVARFGSARAPKSTLPTEELKIS
jgi:hypothetical protein